MKTTIIIFFLCLLSPVFLQAQNKDGGAIQLLDEISQKYIRYSSIQIDYTYKAEKEKKVLDSYKGKMEIKGKKYYLTIPGQTFYCDGETIWNYQKESNEISIFEYDEEDESIMNPVQLLIDWQKNYRAKFIREEFENNKTVALVDITPIKQESYFRIRLYIDKLKNEILRFAIYEKDNTIYTYYFDKFTPNVPIDDQKFKLDPKDYPNADVNDMR